MYKYRIVIALLALVLTLTGCNSTVSRKSAQGDHQQVTSEASRAGSLEKLSVHDHYNVCSSLVKLREFKNFFLCHDSLSRRVAAEGGYLEFEYAAGLSFSRTFYNKAWSEYLMEYLLYEAYSALGQYKEVAHHAGKALKLTESKVFVTRAEEEASAGVKALQSIVLLGQGDESNKVRTLGMSISPMLQLGLANVASGNRDTAIAYAQRIAAIDTGSFSTRAYDLQRRASAARIYFSLQDYEMALKAMDSQSSVGLGGLFFDTLNAVNYVNPANYIMVPLYFGATSIQDLRYIHDLEQRFILYRCQLETGNIAQAKQGYDEALAEPKIAGFGQMHYLVLYDRGRIALAEGNTDAAIGFFRRAISVIESQRSSITLERFKIGFVGDKQDIYSTMVETLVRTGQPEQALEYAERAKARALVDLLAYRKDFSSKKQPARARELLKELDKLERVSLASVNNKGAGSFRKVVNTREAIKAVNPELASLVTVSTLSAKQIQAKIKPDEALIEYFYQGESDLFAFVMTNKKVEVFSLSAKGLKQSVRHFRREIDTYPGIGWKKVSKQLYERLISPLYKSIENKKHLTIVPHGVLHYLPFNALAEDRFLIETHTIRLLPSASILQFLNKKNHPSSNLLVMGNPDLNDASMDLPGAENEARAISKSWSDSKVILRKNASETLFKKVSGQFRYIHLASHGEFNPSVPTDSRMLLSADTINDGNLTISEIYDLHLNADMVTLSACQTGLGDVKNGDDVVGLNRGFLYAGAKSIVASLWSVPDESTRVLMTDFYSNLKKKDKRSSMQQAQIKGIKKYKHPIAWAAFQMTGGI